jgi:hypothetical protein
MSEFVNKEYKIPTGYIETGEVNATPLQDGERLDLHMGRPDLKSYADIAKGEAISHAPEEIELNIFERMPENPIEQIALQGLRIETMRQSEAAAAEIDLFALDTMKRQIKNKQSDFGLAA